MNEHAPLARRHAARFLIGSLAALSLAVPAPADARQKKSPEKQAAEGVARKVEKARARAHDAQAERKALHEFEEEVADYLKLHDKQVDRLGARRESLGGQRTLASAIAAKRDKAKPGDVFDREVGPLFRRLIAEQLKGPNTLDARKAVLQGNPGVEKDSVPVVVRVNAVYPVGAPMSTVPASVLATLPILPGPLQYRFVGRDLILLDVAAGLIVDFLPDAAPALSVK